MQPLEGRQKSPSQVVKEVQQPGMFDVQQEFGTWFPLALKTEETNPKQRINLV